jgi:hypothetical protein
VQTPWRLLEPPGPQPGAGDGEAADEAADGDRTRIIALEGRGSTIELPPRERTALAAGSRTMTVCTNDVTLGELVGHGVAVGVGARGWIARTCVPTKVGWLDRLCR